MSNTNKASTYAAVLAELKEKGKCPEHFVHHRAKHLNNLKEADHGKLKQLVRPVRGSKSLKSAYANIKGLEVMCAFRKGQASASNVTGDLRGKVRIVERVLGLSASALSEAASPLSTRLKAEAA